jgi:hypothetical protein
MRLIRLFVDYTLFWIVFIGCFIATMFVLWSAFPDTISSRAAFGTLSEILAGNFDEISRAAFVFTLAAWIVAAGFGFIAAYGVVFALRLSHQIRRAKAVVARSQNRVEFAQNYEAIYAQLSANPVIGHAWREFDETLVKPKSPEPNQVISNTVRPSAFINIELIRGASFGFKMMPSIPGYFVGLGLWLTFVGLVLALDKAGTAVSGSDMDAMQTATRELLQVASFKFATSIAGLGSSILLGIAFRSYAIAIENAFARLCEEIEGRLLYRSPQSISVDMSEYMREQRDYLKDITQGDFFQRFGQEFTPKLQGAVQTAMAPVVSSINTAVGKLSAQNQDGMQELLTEFTRGLQQGAGAEMREFAQAIQQMQSNLAQMQTSMTATSESFGGNMDAAVDRLKELLSSATDGVADRLKSSIDDAAGGLNSDLAAFGAVINKATEALAAQNAAQDHAAQRMQGMVEALSETASQVRNASAPLLQSSGQISTAVQSMEAALQGAVRAIETEKSAAQSLSATVSAKTEELEKLWAGYADRFEKIDQELGTALNALSQATADQSERLNDYTKAVDSALAEAVDKLQAPLGGLEENTGELSEVIEKLLNALRRPNQT